MALNLIVKVVCFETIILVNFSNIFSATFGSTTSTKNKTNSQYISGVQSSHYKPVLWGWVRLKVYFNNNGMRLVN